MHAIVLANVAERYKDASTNRTNRSLLHDVLAGTAAVKREHAALLHCPWLTGKVGGEELQTSSTDHVCQHSRARDRHRVDLRILVAVRSMVRDISRYCEVPGSGVLADTICQVDENHMDSPTPEKGSRRAGE